jgi:hypothetical protein
MLWYNIDLVSYGILMDCWLNLNRVYTCPPIEKLKEDKGVPRACVLLPSRGIVSERAMHGIALLPWRAVHEREPCGALVWVSFATWAA